MNSALSAITKTRQSLEAMASNMFKVWMPMWEASTHTKYTRHHVHVKVNFAVLKQGILRETQRHTYTQAHTEAATAKKGLGPVQFYSH